MENVLRVIRLFRTTFVLCVLCVGLLETRALEVPAEAKQTVGFIYVPVGTTNDADVPNGTGFFLSVTVPTRPGGGFVYFVTAKHVLQRPDKSWFEDIRIRLNLKDGTAKKIVCPLVLDGTNKCVFVHPDPTIDIAVIPWGGAQNRHIRHKIDRFGVFGIKDRICKLRHSRGF